MIKEKRVTPDALPASMGKKGYGRLTLFLGAAAGVGKTYAMLEAAREKLAEGLDVVVGWVNTHGRTETETLLEGLPSIMSCRQEYRDKRYEEMDLDAVLALRPEIAIVDELAHTNAPDSRHPKRYQDVEELLSMGINVYTTLNIQQVESLNDIVAQITGVTVKETVPDSILEVSQIQLVDIPPEELIERLNAGKVYVHGNSGEPTQKFFRPGNINALREMALRYTARRVDRQVESYMRMHGIAGPWPAGERVMVCVSPSPFSAQLIRIARRMADGLQSEWLAVYIETPRRHPASEAEKDRLSKNLHLAEELGAETLNITGNDVAEELLDLARKRNVSQIIIGKPLHSKLWEWLHGSVVEKIIRMSQDISVHVIPGLPQQERERKVISMLRPGVPLIPYAGTLLAMILVTFLSSLLAPFLGLVNIALVYLLPVLFSAVKWGTGPAVVAAVLGILYFDFFFVPPTLTFTVGDLRYLFSFFIFILVALFTGTLSTSVNQQVINSRRREARISALYSLSRNIAAVPELEKVAGSIVNKVAETIEGQVVLFLPDKKGKLVMIARSTPHVDNFLNENEGAVSAWVYNHGQKAGRGTDTLGTSEGLYLPLLAEQGVRGVLGIRANNPEIYFQPEQLRLLDAFTSLAAMAVTRAQLAEQAKASHMLTESERLRTALFNSLSHDLRTPLASITGAVTGLLESDNVYSPQVRRELLKNIQLGALRMNRFVNNLLDMARLESGLLKLNKDWCDIQDIIGVALGRLDATLSNRPLKIDIQTDLPLVQADFVLIEQVLVNLIDNALKYSEPGSEIAISVRVNNQYVEVSVSDIGQKIPSEEIEKIFDKFYRLKSPRLVSGTGLGLAICKGFIEAHGGRIWAHNNPDIGVVMTFTLPLEKHVSTMASADGEGDAHGQ